MFDQTGVNWSNQFDWWPDFCLRYRKPNTHAQEAQTIREHFPLGRVVISDGLNVTTLGPASPLRARSSVWTHHKWTSRRGRGISASSRSRRVGWAGWSGRLRVLERTGGRRAPPAPGRRFPARSDRWGWSAAADSHSDVLHLRGGWQCCLVSHNIQVQEVADISNTIKMPANVHQSLTHRWRSQQWAWHKEPALRSLRQERIYYDMHPIWALSKNWQGRVWLTQCWCWELRSIADLSNKPRVWHRERGF